MNPDIAQALAVTAPFLVALMTKADASNQVKAGVSVGLIAILTLVTLWGDQNPETFALWVAYVGQLAGTVIGVYKIVDALLPTGLNELILPSKGLG